MHTSIHADDIHVGERQRKEFKEKDLLDLAKSIVKIGLIHAPVLTTDYQVVAGERRLRALALTEELGSYQYAGVEYTYPEVPVHLIPDKDESRLFEIELEENIRRVNLTAMEEAQAIAKLHSVRAEANPSQTMKATAKEVTQLQGKETTAKDEQRVAHSILIDQFKDDPEVQKAAKISLNKAARVAKKKMELEFLSALAGTEDRADNPLFTVYPGAAEDILPTLPDKYFDILLFDPPYGVQASTFGEQSMALGHQYEDSPEYAEDFLHSVLIESERFLKDDAHILMFCVFEHFHKWKSTYERFNYKVWPRPIIWNKGQYGHAPVPDYGPRYSYECILFATRGRRKIARLINDVLSTPPARDKIHAAEKPVELLRSLIEFVAKPGNRILDPCVGSGSIFEGGKGLEVEIVGIEKDPQYYAAAKERAK